MVAGWDWSEVADPFAELSEELNCKFLWSILDKIARNRQCGALNQFCW